MSRYLNFVHKFAKLILAGLAILTGFFIYALGGLTADSNPYLLPESHPARKSIIDMQSMFTGTFDAVLIAQVNEIDVFNRESLHAAFHFAQTSRTMILTNDSDQRQLEALIKKYPALGEVGDAILADGFQQSDFFDAQRLLQVASTLPLQRAESSFFRFLPHRLNPIEELAGIAASENIFIDDQGTLVARPSVNSFEVDPDAVRREVMENEMLLNGVISEDGKVALTVVELGIKQDDAEGQLRAYEAFSKIVADYQQGHPEFTDQIHIAGVPIFFAEQKRLIDKEMAVLFPLVILIVAIILIAFFRKPLGIALPLINVIMCSIWTLGMMALFGTPLDLITSVLPVFLITICGADAIHIMAEYFSEKKSGIDNRAAVDNTMRVMVSPVLLTTVTTVVAFLVSSATDIEGIRNFGIYMAAGLVTAQIISLLLIPAWLSIWATKKPVSEKERVRPDRLAEFLARVMSGLLQHRRLAMAGFFILLAGAAASASRINIEDAGAEYFKPDNQYRISDDFVNSHVAGTSPGWIMFEAQSDSEIFSVETVKFIDELDKFLLTQENVTYTYSLATYIKRIFYVMNDMNPAYNRVPDAEEIFSDRDENGDVTTEIVRGDDIVRQSIVLYENGGGADLTNVLNSDFSKTAVLFTMNTTRATQYQALLATLNDWLAENKPEYLTVTLAGTPVIWTGVLDEILNGQVQSTLLALFAVFVVVAIWMKSLRSALMTTLPLAVTLVFFYGMMPLAGIDLNIGTAIIAFLVVGIVDYAVHFNLRIRHGLDVLELPLDDAIIQAVRSSGKSIMFNVLVFSLGFLSLLLAEYEPVVHLGALVSASLAISGLMSLFVIAVFAPWLIKTPVAAPLAAKPLVATDMSNPIA